MTREAGLSVTPGNVLDQPWHTAIDSIRSLGFPAGSQEPTDGPSLPLHNALALSRAGTAAGGASGGQAGSLPAGIRNSLEWLNQYLDGMSASVSAITSVSKQARLIAFNARIEAARHQSVGNSFAVIADEMKMMAVELTPITNKIELQLFEMRHKISELSDMLDLMSEYAAGSQTSPASFQRPEPQRDGSADEDRSGGPARSA
jgi:hypothetical protein